MQAVRKGAGKKKKGESCRKKNRDKGTRKENSSNLQINLGFDPTN